jgi:hypothetical protein
LNSLQCSIGRRAAPTAAEGGRGLEKFPATRRLALVSAALGLANFIFHRRVQMARKQRAAERRAEQWAELRRRRDEEERRQRVMVITEFDAGDPEATMHAMATEILRYRLCVRQFADAIELTRAGAEFGLLRPGPSWRPKRAPEMPDAVPPAA